MYVHDLVPSPCTNLLDTGMRASESEPHLQKLGNTMLADFHSLQLLALMYNCNQICPKKLNSQLNTSCYWHGSAEGNSSIFMSVWITLLLIPPLYSPPSPTASTRMHGMSTGRITFTGVDSTLVCIAVSHNYITPLQHLRPPESRNLVTAMLAAGI